MTISSNDGRRVTSATKKVLRRAQWGRETAKSCSGLEDPEGILPVAADALENASKKLIDAALDNDEAATRIHQGALGEAALVVVERRKFLGGVKIPVPPDAVECVVGVLGDAGDIAEDWLDFVPAEHSARQEGVAIRDGLRALRERLQAGEFVGVVEVRGGLAALCDLVRKSAG